MSRKILILGGDSQVGRTLMSLTPPKPWKMIATTRRVAGFSERIFVDLLDPETWQNIPPDVTNVIFLAGQTSIEKCRTQENESYYLNVQCTSNLIKRLLLDNKKVTFVSSNSIFDGRKSFRTIHDTSCPITNYGRHKSIIENEFFDNKNFKIVRMTKIFESMESLIIKWNRALKNGDTVEAYTDVKISPIKLLEACEALLRISISCPDKIVHLSSKRDITYYELAQILCRLMSNQRFDFSTQIQPIHHKFYAAVMHNSLLPSINLETEICNATWLEKKIRNLK